MLNLGDVTILHPQATWNSSISISLCCEPKKGVSKIKLKGMILFPCTCIMTQWFMSSSLYHRQLTQARDRIATGLKKLLETNDLVVNMEVRHTIRTLILLDCVCLDRLN